MLAVTPHLVVRHKLVLHRVPDLRHLRSRGARRCNGVHLDHVGAKHHALGRLRRGRRAARARHRSEARRPQCCKAPHLSLQTGVHSHCRSATRHPPRTRYSWYVPKLVPSAPVTGASRQGLSPGAPVVVLYGAPLRQGGGQLGRMEPPLHLMRFYPRAGLGSSTCGSGSPATERRRLGGGWRPRRTNPTPGRRARRPGRTRRGRPARGWGRRPSARPGRGGLGVSSCGARTRLTPVGGGRHGS